MNRSTVLLWAALLASGCGGSVPTGPDAADPEVARRILNQALDAWKTGKSPADLTTDSPSIRVADEDWLAGMRLVHHESVGEVRVLGATARCPVRLSLRDPRGKAVKKDVLYLVGTGPTASVIRHDGP